MKQVLATSGQPSSEKHSDSARASSSHTPKHDAASLIREPQVQETDSSPTSYHQCSASTVSGSLDRPTASSSSECQGSPIQIVS